MAKRVFTSGPWKGSYRASEPFVQVPELARLMLNGYVPDPENGSGFYSRPGFVNEGTVATAAGNGQCVISHITSGGTSYNFVIIEGVLYRLSTNFATLTNVTPPNILISATAQQIYAVGYNDGIVFNDGQNPAWYATNLGGTPITATHIDFVDNATMLSIGVPDTTVLLTTGFALRNGTFEAIPAQNLALPAGTVPANQWAVYRVSTGGVGVGTVTAGAANYTTGYANEAAAIAAVPNVPTGEYNVGYFTLQTAVGLPFVAGTDALQGGAAGNPANATNYYAGLPRYPWKLYGQPEIYAGSVFFIGDIIIPSGATTTSTARSTIVWSEPNFPLVGYQQTDYDNLWELTQTSTEPIHAVFGTNDALYYFRPYSIGAVSGTPGINFQGTATNDVVSGNVGCLSGKSVQQFGPHIYFADQFGRPWRMPIGGAPEPLWLQAREIFEDAGGGVPLTFEPWAVIEPNLNLYLLSYQPNTGAWLAFDTRTGAFVGAWTAPVGVQSSGGTVLTTRGERCVLVTCVTGGVEVTLQRLTLTREATWTDEAASFAHILQTHYQGYDADEQLTPTHIVAIAETGNAATPVAATGTLYTMNRTGTLSSFTPNGVVASTDGIGRYVWEAGSGFTGRGVRVQVSFVPTTNQVKLYRVVTHAESTGSSIYDR